MAILGGAVGPVSLALAAPLEQPDDPWFVASSEPTAEVTLQEYGLRFDIEESFRDEKSGGFQLQTSRLATPEALERLLLILALTTLYLTSLGVGVVHAQKSRFVDHHRERRLSYMKLGWQQKQAGGLAFAPFWLDPAPDPFPVLSSRRTRLGGSHARDLPTTA
ncbi:MAG: hypothetical protein ACJ8CB_07205 [Ktedonobacteraceae bacterium]